MSDFHTEVRSLLQRLQGKRHVSKKLYKLSGYYSNGFGVPQSDEKANILLFEAAKLGHPDACYKIARDNLENNLEIATHFVNIGLKHNPQNQNLFRLKQTIAVKKIMHDSEKKQLEEAKAMFSTKRGLEEAIRAEILPCVVSLVRHDGSVGSGFFQHSDWLVTNAHVLPSTEILVHSSLVDFQDNVASIEVKRAFHRPSEKSNAPDIVIVNGNSRTHRNNKCIPLEFSGDSDCGGRIVFYVYFNHEMRKHQIKHLITRSKPGSYPMIYDCEDGIAPQPGCSGAPVIEARVLTGGHDIKWNFRTIGIVYGRYPILDKKFLCAIPAREDFRQILNDIIHPESHAQITSQMSYASAHHIRNGAEQAAIYQADSQAHDALAVRGLREFEAGITILNIGLPAGLEKLIYSNKELIEMSDKDAGEKLEKADKVKRKALLQEEQKAKEEALANIREQAKTVACPVTDKFKRDHMPRQDRSVRDSAVQIATTRKYGSELGKKSSSVVRISDEQAHEELKAAVQDLKSSDLVRKEDGSFVIKHGKLHETQNSYRASTTPVTFSRPGHRKIYEPEHQTAKPKVALKIEKDGPKLHHLDSLKF